MSAAKDAPYIAPACWAAGFADTGAEQFKYQLESTHSAEFMSDTENRGLVLFVMLTNRPDKLDTDIKRPGRLDRKIPFFYADTAQDRASIAQAVLRRYDDTLVCGKSDLEALCEGLSGYSNADLEALVLLGLDYFARETGLTVVQALQKARLVC